MKRSQHNPVIDWFWLGRRGQSTVLSIDDDIFLTPKQWTKFFEFLLVTRSVRTELLDTFIARAPNLRMAARFII